MPGKSACCRRQPRPDKGGSGRTARLRHRNGLLPGIAQCIGLIPPQHTHYHNRMPCLRHAGNRPQPPRGSVRRTPQEEGDRIARKGCSDCQRRAIGSRDTASEASQHPRSSRPAGGARPPAAASHVQTIEQKKAIFRSILPPRRRRAQGAHCGPEAPYNPLNNS